MLRLLLSVSTHQVDQLTQPEAQLDEDRVRVVADRPDEPVVVAEEVIVKPLGVGVGERHRQEREKGGQHPHHRRMTMADRGREPRPQL